ncbi:MAG: hypothetical protein EBR54_00255 [Flavobacteriia bacterium]|nr:hypothetical protein [Flavobacteriia bacterium]
MVNSPYGVLRQEVVFPVGRSANGANLLQGGRNSKGTSLRHILAGGNVAVGYIDVVDRGGK